MSKYDTIGTYIKLVTVKDLDKEQVREWYDTVKAYAPSGVMTTFQTTDNHGNLRNITLMSAKQGNKREYIVPLIRNLIEKEAERIIEKVTFDFDYDIEISSAVTKSFMNNVTISEDKYKKLCEIWARQKHESWMNEKIANGWRYGTTISMTNKTHPLLRPWQDLPEQFREVDDSEPKSLLKLMSDEGYVVLTKDELKNLKK